MLYTEEFEKRMPVLENVNIALAEVLEVRGKPLEEVELWALLGQSIPAIEDLFLTGRAHKNGIPEYTITPCTLQCTAMGRIVICPAAEGESQISLYQAPEIESFKTTEEDSGKLEKYFVYSLGKTIWFAANYDQNASENNFLQNSELKSASSILSNLIVAMTEKDVDKRISFPDFVRACLNNVPQFTNQVPIRKIIVTLHEEVLGSLPEGEILRQVEKNVSNESKDYELDELNSEVDENYSTSKRQSRVFTPNPNSTEFVYGHRFEYAFKDNLLSIEPEPVVPRNTSPRERWKNAFTKVNERRRRDLLITRATPSYNDSTRWDNYKAKESIEKVCEELTERRKMLELLRMNINLAPSVNVDLISNANIAKGIKPKTLAELVMMLKKPKLVRGSSSSSLGSNGSIRSAMSAVARTSSTPEKTSHKSTGGSTSLLKNVVTANLKKRANPSFYSTFDSESCSSNCTQYSWNPTAYTYYGPEFIIRSTMSPIKMRLSSPSQDRTNSMMQFKATVILLSGQHLMVTSNSNVSGRRLFHSVAHQIALPEPNLFGLATKKGDEYLFIDTKQKLNKIKLLNPNTELVTLYLRVKYFLPDINFLSMQPLKHLYYLQLRRSILERKIFCSYEKGVSLAGLALQAEFGDYNRKRFGGGDYFLLEHYLPDCVIRGVCDREDTKIQIFQSHLENSGKTCEEVEDEYIRAVMDLPEYGYHFYSVLQDKNDDSSEVWVSISAWGVDVFEDQNDQRSMCQSYSWSNIRQISFSKRYFTLVPKSQSLTGKPVKYMFFIGDYTKSCSLFGMAVGHHRFFVKQKIEKSLSVNSSLEELDLIPFSSITNNENANEDEDIEYKINPDSINDYQENPKSWISNFANKYFEGVRNTSFGTPKKNFVHKLTKSHSVSEKEPIDSIRKEFGISIKSPLPPLSSFHSSLKRLSVDEPPSDYRQNSRHYDDSYEVLLLRSDLENGLGLTLTCGCDESALLRGTFVESVSSDGPCRGKVNQGDRLIALNGERVEDKNYLQVVDIIGEVTGDVLLTLVPAVSNKKLSLELKFEMPSRLEDNEGANTKTKQLEDCIFNGNSKYELDDNRNISTSLDAWDPALDKNDNQIKNNNLFSAAELITSPPVPARRRRKNTYKSSLSSSGGEGENCGTATTTDGNSVGGIPTTTSTGTDALPPNSSRNGSEEGNGEPLTSASLQRRADDDDDWETTRTTLPTTNRITFGEMGTFQDSSSAADVKRRRTSRDERQDQEEEASRQFAQDSTVYEVTLRKINESFGFRVAERYEFVDGFRRGIFVHSLIPRGSAELDARIKPGDQLIKINGSSTEELSYKEGVALLKRSPDTGTLCFLRINQFSTADSEIPADYPDEDSRNMISKWGRRGSRSSLASQTNSGCSSPTTTVRNIASPIYARSISQVILPTVEELRALAEKDDKYYQEEIETRNLNRDSFNSKSTEEMGYIEIPSLAVESPSVNGTNGVVINGNVNSERSSPVANGDGGSLKTCPNKSAATDFSKEMLGIVPENYSLSSYDSVFNSDNGAVAVNESLIDHRPNVTGSAAKYLAVNRVGDDDRDVSPDYTGTSSGQSSPNDGEPKPLPRKKKNKCGFIEKPEDVLKFTNETNCFQVTIRKSSRGLGLAIFGGVDMSRLGPICQLIRIRKLYPLQPAVACGELNVGDVILEVNGLNTIGLTNTEALETLRVASTDVVLKIFRPDPSLMPPVTFFIQDLSPASSAMISPTGSATNTLKRPSTLNCGSNTMNTYINTTLTKQEGTLGFSVFRYEKCGEDDYHSTGIYVKALIREPAISNGQIQAGDRILRVNEEEVSHLSRSEAVALLRNSGDSVTLKLYRFCEPLSPRSSEDGHSHSKPLRIEARELLSDKARRKSDGNSSSPRRVRDRTLKRESTSSSSSTEFKNSHDVPVTLPDSIEESPLTPDEISSSPTLPLPDAESDDSEMDLSGGLNRNSRPKSLDLLCINEKKQNSVRSEVEELEDGNQLFHRQASVVVPNSNESNNNETRQIDENGEGLLKWRGATLLSTEENVARLNLSLSTLSSGCQSPLSDQSQNGSNGELNSPPAPPRRLTSLQSWDSTPEETEEFLSSGQKLRKLYVQLDRGWQSRLGFSLGDQLPSDANRVSPQVSSPVVTAVHSGSLAHKDGRIAVGDRLIEVNGESLLDKTSAEVIDLLRKTRGKVHLVLLRVSNDNKEPLI